MQKGDTIKTGLVRLSFPRKRESREQQDPSKNWIPASAGMTVMVIICFVLFPFESRTQEQNIDITLTWSANTYVPPGYPGKPLPTYGSTVELTAIINSPNVDPDGLIYNWTVNGASELVGRGQSVFRLPIKEKINRDYRVRLELRDLQNTYITSSNYITLAPREPELIVRSDSYEIASNETAEFTAIPFFFNIEQPNELNYGWRVGSELPSRSGHSQNELSLSIGEINQAFQETLEVWASHPGYLLQKAQTVVPITFIP